MRSGFPVRRGHAVLPLSTTSRRCVGFCLWLVISSPLSDKPASSLISASQSASSAGVSGRLSSACTTASRCLSLSRYDSHEECLDGTISTSCQPPEINGYTMEVACTFVAAISSSCTSPNAGSNPRRRTCSVRDPSGAGLFSVRFSCRSADRPAPRPSRSIE